MQLVTKLADEYDIRESCQLKNDEIHEFVKESLFFFFPQERVAA